MAFQRQTSLLSTLLIVSSSSSTAALPECGPSYETARDYAVGDVVSIDGKNYECDPPVYASRCDNESYAPGKSGRWGKAWTVAWTLLDDECQGQATNDYKRLPPGYRTDYTDGQFNAYYDHLGPKTEPLSLNENKMSNNYYDDNNNNYDYNNHYNSNFNSNYNDALPKAEYHIVEKTNLNKNNKNINNAAPACATAYDVRGYGDGEVVSVAGRNYACKPYPATAWCSVAGYAPGTSLYWEMAWTALDECNSGTPANSNYIDYNYNNNGQPTINYGNGYQVGHGYPGADGRQGTNSHGQGIQNQNGLTAWNNQGSQNWQTTWNNQNGGQWHNGVNGWQNGQDHWQNHQSNRQNNGQEVNGSGAGIDWQHGYQGFNDCHGCHGYDGSNGHQGADSHQGPSSSCPPPWKLRHPYLPRERITHPISGIIYECNRYTLASSCGDPAAEISDARRGTISNNVWRIAGKCVNGRVVEGSVANEGTELETFLAKAPPRPTYRPIRIPRRMPTRGPTRRPTTSHADVFVSTSYKVDRWPTRRPTRRPKRRPTKIPTRRPTGPKRPNDDGKRPLAGAAKDSPGGKCGPAFRPGRSYSIDDVVSRGGRNYRCMQPRKCKRARFEPEEGQYWTSVWIMLGSCRGDGGNGENNDSSRDDGPLASLSWTNARAPMNGGKNEGCDIMDCSIESLSVRNPPTPRPGQGKRPNRRPTRRQRPSAKNNDK